MRRPLPPRPPSPADSVLPLLNGIGVDGADGAMGRRVFETAAELFALLASPQRLKIISAVCQAEKTVTQLLEEIGTTQPNISQHLATLHRRGVLARRREGQQVWYRLQDPQVAALCRTVCTQVAIDLDDEPPPPERQSPC